MHPHHTTRRTTPTSPAQEKEEKNTKLQNEPTFPIANPSVPTTQTPDHHARHIDPNHAPNRPITVNHAPTQPQRMDLTAAGRFRGPAGPARRDFSRQPPSRISPTAPSSPHLDATPPCAL